MWSCIDRMLKIYNLVSYIKIDAILIRKYVMFVNSR